jgi:hypothetical protein
MSTKAEPWVPKEPRLFKEVRRQVEVHEKFESLPKDLLFVYKMTIVLGLGLSHGEKQSRKLVRALWRHLYLGHAFEDANMWHSQLKSAYNSNVTAFEPPEATPAGSKNHHELLGQGDSVPSPRDAKRAADDRGDQDRHPSDVKVPKHD